MSHTIRNKNKPKQFSFANPMITISDNIPSISNSIELCEGAYVGYNSVIFSGIIGKHALIKSFSIVNNDFT